MTIYKDKTMTGRWACRLALAALLLLMGGGARAQLAQGTQTHTAELHFPNGGSTVDGSCMDNAEQLGRLRQMADEYRSIPEQQRYVVMHSYASPDGTEARNRELSAERARNVARLFLDSLGTGTHIVAYRHLYDWQLLYRLAKADTQLPCRDEALRLLQLAALRPDGQPIGDADSRNIIAQLKRLGNGQAYAHLKRTAFPKMRRVTIETRFLGSGGTGQVKEPTDTGEEIGDLLPPAEMEPTPQPTPPADTIAAPPTLQMPFGWMTQVFPMPPVPGRITIPSPTTLPAAEPSVERERRPLYLALKTNALLDLAAIPNVSAEWAFAPHWSVAGEYMHAWWKTDRTHKYWRTYGGNAELRYWMGARRLSGHHVGAYFGMCTYDFEWKHRGYLARKWSRNMGLSYGYSKPIAKRLNLDMELGVGFFTGRYEEYVPQGNYYFWEATKNRKWVGPTRLEATLVWLIGHGNKNE